MNPGLAARLQALGCSLSEVEERFVRGSGPGGQKINKASSTVVLRHRPTGIEVRCQDERSQAANREAAWLRLCARLEDRSRAAAGQLIDERERERRRRRQKSSAQKARLVASKHHRARTKSRRGRVGEE